jgi:uncharacterized protein (DUF488 family)
VRLEQVTTIGVYGWDADGFLRALADEGVDLFCDIRLRRGVRGREYAFANAKRLEAALAQAEIPYRHVLELAPTQEIRSAQYALDATAGVAMRQRSELSPAFVEAYGRLLDGAAAEAALASIREKAARPGLFCVERLPSACHRSLAAERIAGGAVPVRHLLP